MFALIVDRNHPFTTTPTEKILRKIMSGRKFSRITLKCFDMEYSNPVRKKEKRALFIWAQNIGGE
jgi:hypothetical protein